MSKRPRPVFFQHLQKTGGTSLIDTLQPFFSPERTTTARLYYRQFIQGTPALAERYDLVAGHSEILSCAPPDAFKVAIFRDPLTRLLSARRQVEQAGAENIAAETPEMAKAIVALQRRSMADVLAVACDYLPMVEGFWNHQAVILGVPIRTASRKSGNLQGRRFASGREYLAWLVDSKAKILEAALQTLRTLDYVGLTEDFENSVREIFARIGLPEPGDVVVRNARPPIEDESDPRLPELAKEFIELDSELYEAAVERHAVLGRVARGIPIDYIDRKIASTEGLVVTGQDAPGGHGWWPCHRRADGTWGRWSGPGSESRIAVHTPAGTFALKLTVFGAVSAAALHTMIIEIEGRALQTKVAPEPSGLWSVSATFERDRQDRFDIVLRFPGLKSEYGLEFKQILLAPCQSGDTAEATPSTE